MANIHQLFGDLCQFSNIDREMGALRANSIRPTVLRDIYFITKKQIFFPNV